ncbi:cyclic-di-AMP-binding protein CbpB [Alicyclobacillus sendaiensis]|uniref:Cyclic-di-AMP-binding protein CbpB n=1 Tax=Alicyclobacillus sendaiensis PA2 TaxID=3029425 RepID=A0ABT6Y0J6_ALISE|nr:cyclic-di-AMP-binding protein CbpB [Alicyclobacillus sendaiensis]MDI9260864.1 cyclic-di-AMP-binding protein CbpB [Alicyclobacillus sendaiensis PA2]
MSMETMQSLTLQDEDIARLIIDADDVACVHPQHSAEHALLVLIKSGYSAIPVVTTDGRVVGIISKTLILDRILGLERIEFEALSTFTVQDVMRTEFHRIGRSEPFLRALQLSIDAPFLCVEDESGKFVGLLTRHGILAYLNGVIRKGRKRP